MKIKDLRAASGMTQQQFSDYFNIPKRTIENWEGEQRQCPEYLLELIKYKLKNEGYIKDTDCVDRPEEIVTKLEMVRTAAGMTQQQLSEKSGVGIGIIEKSENREGFINHIGLARQVRLCEALGCQMRDIVTAQELIDWYEKAPSFMKKAAIASSEAYIEDSNNFIKSMIESVDEEHKSILEADKEVNTRDILELKSKGMNNNEIAKALGCHGYTVWYRLEQVESMKDMK